MPEARAIDLLDAAGDRGRDPRVVIVGSGFSGLCLGIALKRAGIDSFVIFEQAEGIGGTWRDNTYPGACCDVPSIFYCFSFEQRTDWPRLWSPQSEILAYMEHCARKYGLEPHVKLRTRVLAARFDSRRAVWKVRTDAGDEVEAEILVSGVGQLHKPFTPAIPGKDDFQGALFHSARWRHDVSLAGKRVAVVGNAASAIQLIPEIAKQVAALVVYQRSANWMIERGDRPYRPLEHELLARVPGLARLNRAWVWLRAELLLYPVMRGNRWLRAALERRALAGMRAAIADAGLREKLTPDYPAGGKRVLISDDYYAALNRPNVHLETERIEAITRQGVRTASGESPFDVIVFATGFDTTHFVSPMVVESQRGSLEEVWKEGAEGYLGLMVSGFPNFFMMYGPNTNLGHNSIIFMIECQTRYVMQCVERLRRGESRAIDVKPAVMAEYNRQLQADLAGTAWARTDRSWYKNEAGRITNNWPYSTLRYWWQTRRVDWSAYDEVA